MAPNARAYALFKDKISDYIKAHVPPGKQVALFERLEEIVEISHLNNTVMGPALPPDNDFTTRHFWNLHFPRESR